MSQAPFDGLANRCLDLRIAIGNGFDDVASRTRVYKLLAKSVRDEESIVQQVLEGTFLYLTHPRWDMKVFRRLLCLTGLAVYVGAVLLAIVALCWIGIPWAIQFQEYDGPQWRKLAIFPSYMLARICFTLLPLGGFFELYGAFCGWPLRGGSRRDRASSWQVAFRWALAWILPTMLLGFVSGGT